MPVQPPAGTGRRAALLVASAGYFFVLLDVTIVNVALARIGLATSAPPGRAAVGGRCLRADPRRLHARRRRPCRPARLAAALPRRAALFGLASAACAAAPGARPFWSPPGSSRVSARRRSSRPRWRSSTSSTRTPRSGRGRSGSGPGSAARRWSGRSSAGSSSGRSVGGRSSPINVPLVALSLLGGWKLFPAGPRRAAARRPPRAAARHPRPGGARLRPDRRRPRRVRDGTGDRSPRVVALGALAAFVCGRAAPPPAAARHPLVLPPRVLRRQRRRRPDEPGDARRALRASASSCRTTEGLSPLEPASTWCRWRPLAVLALLSGRLVARIGPRLPAGSGCLPAASPTSGFRSSRLPIDAPVPAGRCWRSAGIGMAIAVPGLVAGPTEALGPGRAGMASASTTPAARSAAPSESP